MLARAVQSYLSIRRAAGFSLTKVGLHLNGFAAHSDAKGQRYVNSQTAIEWARQARSVYARARRPPCQYDVRGAADKAADLER
jgi:integrase/recombinase XerD